MIRALVKLALIVALAYAALTLCMPVKYPPGVPRACWHKPELCR